MCVGGVVALPTDLPTVAARVGDFGQGHHSRFLHVYTCLT